LQFYCNVWALKNILTSLSLTHEDVNLSHKWIQYLWSMNQRHSFMGKSLTALLLLLGCLMACQPEPPPIEPPAQDTLCIDTVTFTNLNAIGTSQSYRFTGSFETSLPTQAWIEYRADSVTEWQSTALTATGMSHQADLHLLMPSTLYHFRAVCGNGYCRQMSEESTFTTGPGPASIPPLNVSTINLAPFDGYLLMNKNLIPGCVQLVNNLGKTVWYHCFNKPVATFHFTPKGNVIVILGDDQLVEVNLKGEVVADLSLGTGGFDKPVHHDVWVDENDFIYVLTEVSDTFDLSSIGGNANEQVITDGYMILDHAGNKIREWSVFDVASPLDDSTVVAAPTDWLHANTIWKLSDGNLLISFRNCSQLWKIHALTGAILWKLGANGDFALPANATFYRQHYAHEPGDGTILMFDNGQAPERPVSRALSLAVDESSMTAQVVADVALDAAYFTSKMGSVELLPGGNFLFCSSETKNILITDDAGQVLWQATWNFIPYRVAYVPRAFVKLF
jgi:arylsulfate sulfotransferase